MKKILAILIVAVLAITMLSSCGSESQGFSYEADNRFSIERTVGVAGHLLYVLTDTDTGVQYLFYKVGYAGGLTALLNPDGTPMTK